MASASVSALTFLNIGLLPGNVNWNKPFLPPQVAFRSDSLDLLYSIVILGFKDAGLLEGGVWIECSEFQVLFLLPPQPWGGKTKQEARKLQGHRSLPLQLSKGGARPQKHLGYKTRTGLSLTAPRLRDWTVV